ncbi:flagellar filament outer layer protein FlaA [Entomospira nematocerorum]|uniref:Flagellar filament protein FlaA n=1 Tax=Entomospira nematocerorum TaxID=2719987 RepID=A0A968GCP8_9SPIO|nr:flagellar filament outer layer protein FlaA [Entomospira nematocera]NIZ46824.1 hypothetical protein [Entomospira nematocera]WDI33379.1 flagellar filament outer layer protein FlaA [Entomospira nematocera]
MKKSLALIGIFFLTMSFGAWAQDMGAMLSLDTHVVDSFDGDGVYPDGGENIQWIAVGSQNIVQDFPLTTQANVWPREKFGENPANSDDLRALAINGAFTQRGRNFIEIIPTRDGSTPSPLPLTDEVRALGVWVWGSNFNYTFLAVVEDADGVQHRINMGRLNYMGWRNLTATIPNTINQRNATFPLRRTLRLVKFIIDVNPAERADNFFVYIDNVTTISQRRIMTGFDGSNLTEPTVIDQIWEGQPINANAGQVGSDVAVADPTKLQEVQVSTMNDPSAWVGQMRRNDGLITVRSFEGGAADKEPLNGEESESDEQNRILGTRIQFLRRSLSQFTIKAVNPIPIQGVTKTISVWVAGRNTQHTLSIVIRDYEGRRHELVLGQLDFSGWKQLSVSIPENVVQNDPNYGHIAGITFEEFIVHADLLESRGTFFLWLDDVRALVDMFAVATGRAEDDPRDELW